jgi:hypothetical protein
LTVMGGSLRPVKVRLHPSFAQLIALLASFELCCHAPIARRRSPVRARVWHSGTDLHLAILVPTAESWPEGRASIGAISLAIDFVNARAQGSQIGPEVRGRNLTYRWKEVDCDRFKALAALSQILEEGPVDAVIGPDCSAACESTAILTSARELPQISYSCSSAALSDKTTYPTVRLARGPRVRITCAVCTMLATRPYPFDNLLGSLFARHRVTQAGCQRY